MGGKTLRESCLHLTGGVGVSVYLEVYRPRSKLHTVNRTEAKGARPHFRFVIGDIEVERYRFSGPDANLVGIELHPMRIHAHVGVWLIEDLRKEIRPPVHPTNPPLCFCSIKRDATTMTGKKIVWFGIKDLLGHIAVTRNRGPILGDKRVNKVPLFPK